MSKVRSPCTVCSTTIGICGLIAAPGFCAFRRSKVQVDSIHTIARAVSGYRTRFEAIEKRLAEVEQVNVRLESATLTTSRAVAEISKHRDAVYEATRRSEEQPVSERQHRRPDHPGRRRGRGCLLRAGGPEWRRRSAVGAPPRRRTAPRRVDPVDEQGKLPPSSATSASATRSVSGSST